MMIKRPDFIHCRCACEAGAISIHACYERVVCLRSMIRVYLLGIISVQSEIKCAKGGSFLALVVMCMQPVLSDEQSPDRTMKQMKRQASVTTTTTAVLACGGIIMLALIGAKLWVEFRQVRQKCVLPATPDCSASAYNMTLRIAYRVSVLSTGHCGTSLSWSCGGGPGAIDFWPLGLSPSQRLAWLYS
jgi:hypothetical protein